MMPQFEKIVTDETVRGKKWEPRNDDPMDNTRNKPVEPEVVKEEKKDDDN